ncbi:MAG: GntR family transcriptional regulator [Rhodospirillaceae bacterium]|nr:GntR family transcriptional regulator [Rhodospirillaceae bacterium]
MASNANLRLVGALDETIKSPRYHQLYSIIKGWILNGTYLPGAKIPPESELCDAFGVSRITSHQAINLLVQEGLLKRVQGKGTFVSTDLKRPASIGDMDQMISKTITLAKNSKVQNVDIKKIKPDAETCEDLQISADVDVFRITFVRIANKERLDYREAYIPTNLGLDFTKAEIKNHPMYTLFERKGMPAATGHLLMGARSADPHLASLLSVQVGSPLLRNRLIVMNQSGVPIQRSITHFRADRFEQYVYLGQFGEKGGKSVTVF